MIAMNSVGRWSAVVLALVALGALSGCKKSNSNGGATSGGGGASGAGAAVGGLGVQLYEGAAEDLRVTPDGAFATFLVGGEKPRIDGIPPQMRVGELWMTPLQGGRARKVGNGVTNVPGGYLFSQDGRWVLFLAGYNATSQSGALNVYDLRDPSASAEQVGRNVSYALSSPDGAQLAFVEGGVLRVGPLPRGPFRDVAGEVSTASFSPDGKQLYFKRRLSAAGGLAVVPTEAGEKPVPPKKLADQVGDYTISPDGKYVVFSTRDPSQQGGYDLFHASTASLAPRKIGTGAAGFAFSADSKWLGRIEGQRVDELGTLFVGPADGSPGRPTGEKVLEFAFSPDSSAVAAMELYDITARAGVLGVTELQGESKVKRVGNRVPNFVWSDDGKHIAFLSRFIKPIYSVDLMLYSRGKDAAVKANPGVFGYGFTYPGGPLLFRTNCIREGRACDLMGVPPEKAGQAPDRLVEKIFSFKTSVDGKRTLVTYARTHADTYDVALYDNPSGARVTLDQFAQLPALFAAKDGSRVVYILGKQSRAPGVYVAAPQLSAPPVPEAAQGAK